MPKGLGGYQPDTKAPSSRRADFDLQRRLAVLERNGGVPGPQGPQGPAGPAGPEGPNEVWISETEPTDPLAELWYNPVAVL